MNFTQYEEDALSSAIYPDKGQNPYYPILGLCGETGEVAEKIKKQLRGDKPVDRVEIIKELGDVLWYLNALCYEFNTSLEEIAIENIKKLRSRKERGVLQGSGDNR